MTETTEDRTGTAVTDATGTSKSKSSDLLGDLAKIAQTAALFASDRRLKTDVFKLYTRPDGLGVYLYRYFGWAQRFIGVMAQEVREIMPDAVVTMPNGYLAVDYGRL